MLCQGITANFADGFFVTRTSVGSGTTAVWNGNQLQLLTSARRFKENIRPLESVSDKIDQLIPTRFESNLEPRRECIGFIAEEVANIFPELVTYEEDGVRLQSVMYPQFVSILTKDIQEMHLKFKEMQRQIDELINNK